MRSGTGNFDPFRSLAGHGIMGSKAAMIWSAPLAGAGEWGNFSAELKRPHICRVAATYVVVAWNAAGQ
jgi:hypothetical protein